MSINDECELQELVKQALEKNGSLSKMRAELRARVFLALEENGCFQNMKSENNGLKNVVNKTDGILLISLVKEFLEYLGLSFTAAVLDPEIASYDVKCARKNRSDLIKDLNMSFGSDVDTNSPLLYQILQQLRVCQARTQIQATYNSAKQDVVTQPLTSALTDNSKEQNDAQPLRVSEKQAASKLEITAKSPKSIATKISAEDVGSDLKRNMVLLSLTNVKEAISPSKLSLSSLGDLPPLNTQVNCGKGSSSSTAKSTQITKLKAMLIDSSSENNSGSNSLIMTEDELLEEKDDDEDISELEEEHVTKLLQD